jgi:hypothetical protein
MTIAVTIQEARFFGYAYIPREFWLSWCFSVPGLSCRKLGNMYVTLISFQYNNDWIDDTLTEDIFQQVNYSLSVDLVFYDYQT